MKYYAILFILIFTVLFAERGIIGVYSSESPDKKSGVVITKVLGSSPASKAGLKANDVIIEIDGKSTKNRDELDVVLEKLSAGDEITISYKRNNKKYNAKLVLAEFDETVHAKIILRNYIGVEVYNLTSQLKKYFKVKNGVLVAAIDKNSPAAKAGLKAGDIITKVDDTDIDFSGMFHKYISEVASTDAITLNVVRAKKKLKIKSEIEIVEQPYIEDFTFLLENNPDKIKEIKSLYAWADSLKSLNLANENKQKDNEIKKLYKKIEEIEKQLKKIKGNRN